MKPDPRMPELWRQARLVWRMMGDTRISMKLKLIPAAAIIYLISPWDLIPDVIPLLTQIDDVVVIMLAMRLFLQMAPQDVVHEHEDGDSVTTTYRVRDD